MTNSSQWAFYESWDAIDIPGTHGMRKRRCTAKERVLDELMLSWEIATRKRYGMVAGLDDDALRARFLPPPQQMELDFGTPHSTPEDLTSVRSGEL